MKAGRLRHKVTLQRQTGTKDAYQAPTEVYTDLATRRARYVPLSGKESFDDAHELGVVEVRFELRGDSVTRTLTARDRVAHGGATYDILRVVDVNGRGREIHLMCRRVE